MWYGHGSWIFVVIILGVFLLRMTASRRNAGQGRRPGGGPYGPGGPGGPYGGPFGRPGPTSGFPDGGPQGTHPPAGPPGSIRPDDQPGDTAPGTGGSTGMAGGHTGIPAGWMTDPSGRHQQRYWSGTAWTEHVADDGAPGLDPPPGGTGG